MDDSLTPELVDYLIAIVYLTVNRGNRCCAKLVEVSEVLGVAKPTASLMLGKLFRMGLIVKSKDGIGLSRHGFDVIDVIIRRHEVLENMLLQHGLDHGRACEISRKLEVILREEDILTIEKSLTNLRTRCDKPLCRFDSAMRARRR